MKKLLVLVVAVIVTVGFNPVFAKVSGKKSTEQLKPATEQTGTAQKEKKEVKKKKKARKSSGGY